MNQVQLLSVLCGETKEHKLLQGLTVNHLIEEEFKHKALVAEPLLLKDAQYANPLKM